MRVVAERLHLTVLPFQYVVETQNLGFQKYYSISHYLKVAKRGPIDFRMVYQSKYHQRKFRPKNFILRMGRRQATGQ